MDELNERIDRMAEAALDYEVKIRTIKGDSAAVKEAATMANTTHVYETHSCIKVCLALISKSTYWADPSRTC